MQQTELRPALAAQEGKKEGRDKKKIQRDGGGFDGLREEYGVFQRAEQGLIQLEDTRHKECNVD
jgi:hypothetical protein